MKNFVPKDKLSKKARKKEDQKNRAQWGFSPVSRVIPNKKKEYDRRPRRGADDAGWGVFFIARAGLMTKRTASCQNSRIFFRIIN